MGLHVDSSCKADPIQSNRDSIFGRVVFVSEALLLCPGRDKGTGIVTALQAFHFFKIDYWAMNHNSTNNLVGYRI